MRHGRNLSRPPRQSSSRLDDTPRPSRPAPGRLLRSRAGRRLAIFPARAAVLTGVVTAILRVGDRSGRARHLDEGRYHQAGPRRGLLGLVLTTDSRSAALSASRETGTTAPQLVVETAGTTISSDGPPPRRSVMPTTTTTAPLTAPRRVRPVRRHLPERPATEPWSARSGLPCLEPPHSRQRPAGRQLGRHDPPPAQRRPPQRGHGAWGQMGVPVFTRTPARRGTPGAGTAARSVASRCRSRQARARPGAGGEHDHKYIVIATDTTPVHALTI
jgi:hypothetical protein